MKATIQRTFETAFKLTLLTTAIFLFSGSLAAQTFDYSLVHSFDSLRMGIGPNSPLLLDNKGNLYGAALGGGTFGFGAIYEISATGAEKTIYSFTGGGDGWAPYAGLISDPDGNLYGTTAAGGDSFCFDGTGCGVVFKLDSSHHLSVLHTFTIKIEGYGARSALVRDESGNLYGNLINGGVRGNGSVFKLDPVGNFTVLHNFFGTADGEFPNGLIIDTMGNLYGTTKFGGTYGNGTVFKLDAVGHLSILYNFAGGTDGWDPNGALARDSAGNVYGATEYGGDPTCDCGTLFRLNLQSRTKTVLHTFTAVDGRNPNGDLVLDSAGNLYGTALHGGIPAFGVVFMLDANGVYSVLYDFAGTPDGSHPFAGVIMDRAGNLFGTTWLGGTHNWGTVYKLTRQ